jgi:hypothetical protein
MNTKQTLYLEPSGGLGNRMRAIASAYAFAMKHKIPLIVLWKCDSGLNCKYHKLFKITDTFLIKEVNRIQLSYIKIRNILVKGKYDKKGTSKRIDYYEEILNSGKSLYLKSYNQFYPPLSFNVLKPIDELVNEARTILPQNMDNIIGIHIRRGDNFESISNQPLNWFIENIQNQILLSKDIMFYLSTDSYDVEKELLKKFPNKIITQNHSNYSRNSEDGIREALIDLICLSKCKLIFGSYYSSFSTVASEWGNKSKLIIVGKDII